MRRLREAAGGHPPPPAPVPAPLAAPVPERTPEPVLRLAWEAPSGQDVPPTGARHLLRAAVLPVAAGALLAWSLTILIGDVAWGPLSALPVMLACLGPLITIPAGAVAALAVRRHSWTAAVPALAAGLLPWGFVVGYAVPAAPPEGELLPLRAMLVTARNGSADAAEITAAARAQAADLVVVTELSPVLAHDLTRAGLSRSLPPRYVSVPEGGQSAAAGLGIFSRFPVDDVRPLPGTQWPAVRARVRLGATPVTLVAGHAVRPSVGEIDVWRRDLAAFGSAALIRGPVLVLANLNVTPWNAQFRSLVSGRLHDAGDVLGRGLRPTWPNWSPIPLIPTDHALVAGAGVSALATVSIAGTDHRALSVELRVPRS